MNSLPLIGKDCILLQLNTNPGCKNVQGTTVMIKVVKGAKPANVKPLLFIYGAAGEGN